MGEFDLIDLKIDRVTEAISSLKSSISSSVASSTVKSELRTLIERAETQFASLKGQVTLMGTNRLVKLPATLDVASASGKGRNCLDGMRNDPAFYDVFRPY